MWHLTLHLLVTLVRLLGCHLVSIWCKYFNLNPMQVFGLGTPNTDHSPMTAREEAEGWGGVERRGAVAHPNCLATPPMALQTLASR